MKDLPLYIDSPIQLLVNSELSESIGHVQSLIPNKFSHLFQILDIFFSRILQQLLLLY